MSSRGEGTRDRIVAAAERIILEKGFAGTSLDDVLTATGLTKGAFFHHFKGKAELARAVADRYIANDLALFNGFAERAERLADDPLERTLIFLRLFEEWLDALDKPFPGCIFASYTYESGQFGPEIRALIVDGFEDWIQIYVRRFEALIAARPPKRPITARALAEMATSAIQGGFILANAESDKTWVQRQSASFRAYVELLFR